MPRLPEHGAPVSTGPGTQAPNPAPDELATLGAELFTAHAAGTRCLLDHPLVARIARQLATELINLGILTPPAPTH